MCSATTGGRCRVWKYLTRPGASDRIASFTSVSGPGEAQYGTYIFDSLKRPYRPLRFVRAIDRFLRLLYWIPFALPVVAPAVFKGLMRARKNNLLTDGVPAAQRYRSETAAADLVNSLKIYRALAISPPLKFPPDPYVTVPVQLIVGTKDPVVRPHGFDELSRWVPRLWRRDIKAGHWSPMSHPQVMAAAVGELVDFLEGKPASRALLRAQVGRKRDDFGDTLVSVTGAGSGIGRETALAFAREGAELVVSDIDEAGVKEAAAEIVARGGVAHPYVLDVSDADAVERFADAGVRRARRARHRGEQRWHRSGGRVPRHTRRSVGPGAGRQPRRCRQRLQGVREASRRARHRRTHRQRCLDGGLRAVDSTLNAYCTSKAAVYMFSDCLRAELDAAGIGLTTICPGVIDTNIVHTTRFRHTGPLGRGRREPTGATGEVFPASTVRIRTRPPRRSSRRSRRTSRSGPSPRRPTCSTAHRAGAAAGDAQQRPAERSFSSAAR